MSRHLLGGVLLLAGVVFLLFSNNLLPWSLLHSLLSLWPLLLVAWGINLLLSNTPLRGGGTVLLILLLVGLVGTALYARTTFDEQRSHDLGGVFSINNNRMMIGSMQLWYGKTESGLMESGSHDWPEEAERYHATINFGAGTLQLGASDDEDKLLEIHSSETMPHAQPQVQITPGSTAEIDLSGNAMWGFHTRRNQWELAFNGRHPAEFDIQTGAAESQLDFSRIKLKKLTLRVGAASSTVRFGSQVDKLVAEIEQGAAQTTIVVPDDMGVTLNYEGGLSSLDLPRDFRRDDEDRSLYESANLSTASNQLQLTVRSGVGSVKIIRHEATSGEEDNDQDDAETGLAFTRIMSGPQAPYELAPDDTELILFNQDQSLTDNIFDRFHRPRDYTEDNLVLFLLQGEQSTGGYRIRAEKITREGDTLIVETDLTTPRRQDLVTQSETSPYDMVAIPFDEIGPFSGSLTILLVNEETGETVLERVYEKTE